MEDLVPLSDDWLARVPARAIAGRVQFGSADLRVEYHCIEETREVVHHQMFEGGRLTEWEPGPAGDPDVVLRHPMSTHLAMLTRAGQGNDLLAATELLDVESGASLSPPPMDEVRMSWGQDLPWVPTLGELVVRQVMTASPFGTVDIFARLQSGQVVETGLGCPAGPDVVVTRRYGDALRHRAGVLDALASVEHGEVIGAFPTLTMFLGIFDSDECIAARRKLTTQYEEPLIHLGEVLSSPGWQSVAQRISEEVTDMWSVP